jgi:hypothetical protein
MTKMSPPHPDCKKGKPHQQPMQSGMTCQNVQRTKKKKWGCKLETKKSMTLRAKILKAPQKLHARQNAFSSSFEVKTMLQCSSKQCKE